MKIAASLFTSLLLCSAASAAITISGVALQRVGNATGQTPANGTLGLLIVDTTNDGFTAFTNPSSVVPDSSLALGSTWGSGNDVIIGRLSSSGSSTNQTFGSILTNYSLISAGPPARDYTSKNFAIVWLIGATTATNNVAANTNWGFARDNNWVMPASDTGTFAMGTAFNQLVMLEGATGYDAPIGDGGTTATYTYVTDNDGAGPGTLTQSAATFTVVPEPSTAAFALLSGLGLMVRRRRA